MYMTPGMAIMLLAFQALYKTAVTVSWLLIAYHAAKSLRRIADK